VVANPGGATIRTQSLAALHRTCSALPAVTSPTARCGSPDVAPNDLLGTLPIEEIERTEPVDDLPA